jgi:hypothetical protein
MPCGPREQYPANYGRRLTMPIAAPRPEVSMSIIVMATAMAAAIAIGIALVSLSCAAVFARRMLIPAAVPTVPVTLILPATGALPGLDALLAALSVQTLLPARMVVAVEAREDPAYQRVATVAARYPTVAVELVIAGLSDRRAQKCTNLLAALARLDSSDSYIVMLDADIRPQPWWLAALVAPLAAGQADIVNGYRWPAPRSVSLATTLGSSIDRAIAVLPRLERFRLLWGGSIAFTRSALDAIDMPATLAHALTEDLVIADRAAALGLRRLSRRGLRVPTPLDGDFGSLWRFARRQYQIVHIYRPRLWWFALAVCTADLVARVGLVGAAIAAGHLLQPIAIVLCLVLGALGSATLELRLAIGRRIGVADSVGLRLAHHLLVWSFLPIAVFHAGAIWGAFARSPVAWADVRYLVDRQGRVTAALRSPYRDQPGLRAISSSSNE